MLGLKCKDGLLLAVENLRLSKLLVPFSNRRTFAVGDHACIAVAGTYVHLVGVTFVSIPHSFVSYRLFIESIQG